MAGRPTLYRDEYAEQAYKLTLLGLTDEELAQFFGVHLDTIHSWKHAHTAFAEARARGKNGADAKVAARLYKRALGYKHDAVKILQHNGEPVVVPYVEHYPPDTQAATWWLKNRHPDKWKDKHEVEHSASVGFADALAAARERRIAAIEGPLIDAALPYVDAAPQQLTAPDDDAK